MVEGTQRESLHPSQQLPDAGAPRQRDGQGEGVQAKAHQVLELGPGPVRDRRAHDHGVLSRMPVEEDRVGGQQGHEHRRIGRLRQPVQATNELVRQHAMGHRSGGPGGRVGHGVERKVESARCLVQRPGPEARLRFRLCRFQPPSLPGRVVGVPAGRGWQVGGSSARPGSVKLVQFAQEVPERPLVHTHVVEDQKEDVVVRGEARQPATPHGSLRRSKGRSTSPATQSSTKSAELR